MFCIYIKEAATKQELEFKSFTAAGAGAGAGVNFSGAGLDSESNFFDSDHLWCNVGATIAFLQFRFISHLYTE